MIIIIVIIIIIIMIMIIIIIVMIIIKYLTHALFSCLCSTVQLSCLLTY